MKIFRIKSKAARIKKVRKLIQSAENTIGSVWFRKRGDDSLRKMAFRLHTQNPTYAAKPTGERMTERRKHDSDNLQMTVLDVNKVLRAKSGRRKGKISGRGAWRTIPLENVVRTCIKNKISKFIY